MEEKKLDINSIIGFVLIFGILAYMLWQNQPSPEEIEARKEFGNRFASLYDYFDRSTPSDFVGYVYADGLFLDPPQQENGVYTFCPNPKSQTCYHVKTDSDLGRQISHN